MNSDWIPLLLVTMVKDMVQHDDAVRTQRRTEAET